MRFAVLLLALGACDLAFPLEFVDVVPHIPANAEQPGEADLTIPAGVELALDTTAFVKTGDFGGAEFEAVRQDNTTTDVAVMRVRDLTVAGRFVITGDRPLIIVARSISITGAIEASAVGPRPGPGGGRPELDDAGQGAAGTSEDEFMGSRTGGGGGGFAAGAGTSGRVDCPTPRDASAAGTELGEPTLAILQGGGAGGRGGSTCTTDSSRGGGGGGALQLSARETISILGGGGVFGGGGGGEGGLGAITCGNGNGGGGGGGAGGAIYLDAPTITNIGTILATGGGGGGGGNAGVPGMNDGLPGNDARAASAPSEGGTGVGKGTFGGNGATAGVASNGAIGTCGGVQQSFNTGGGGGALGRIVFRSDVKVDPIGNVNPKPEELSRGPEVP